ncbi:MAG TPA: metal-dependent hydrolase [Holophagaceae bacterium]|nr:metal-dependent hydrolase [Holophagaceae bacterium]
MRARLLLASLLMAPALMAPALMAAAPQAKPKTPARTQPITVTWLGHAAFEVVSSGGTHLLLDPFLIKDPATPEAFKDLARYKPDAILVTHSHMDHMADAAALAKQSGAPVIAAYELAATLGLPEKQTMGGNVGGTFTIGDVTIHLVPAMHGSEPGGRPMGFVLTFKDGRSLYHTGDTWIFGDMSLIQELFHPSILLLGVGGGPYTEDPATAALAVRKYFHPSVIVPMHYGTFPGLATEDQVRGAFKGDQRLHVMKPGDTVKF